MSIERTEQGAAAAAAAEEEIIHERVEEIHPAGNKGLHQPDYLRANWMDAKVPGTDAVTVGDAMLYAGAALAVGAVAYGVYRMVKHFSDEAVDAALVGGEVISL